MGERNIGKAPSKKSSAKRVSDIVTSDQNFSAGHTIEYARRFSIVASVLILMGIFWALWSVNHGGKLPDPIVVGVDTDTHYESTDIENIPGLLSLDYGMTIKNAANNTFTDRAKTYIGARNIAIAAERVGNLHAALNAYALAVHYVPKGKEHELYREYMRIAYELGDRKLGDTLYVKAASYIESSADTKEDKSQWLIILKSIQKDALNSEVSR